MKDYLGYNGKTCVVTGGSNGMGAAAVEMLVDLGAEVYVLDNLACKTPGVKYIEVDLQQKESIDKCFKQLPETFDKFFGFAGVSGLNQPHAMVTSINLLSNKYMLDKYLFDRVVAGGAIAFVASTASRFWDKYIEEYLPLLESSWEDSLEYIKVNDNNIQSSYTLSKRAMNYLIKSYCTKFYEKEIRLNNICPAFTKTRLHEDFFTFFNHDPELLKNAGWGVIKRDAIPKEMATGIIFLNSDMASYITGENLFIDGGHDATHSIEPLKSQEGQDIPSFSGPIVHVK